MTTTRLLNKEAGTSLYFNKEDVPGHYLLEGKYGTAMQVKSKNAGKNRDNFTSLGKKIKYQEENKYDDMTAKKFFSARRAYAQELLDDMNSGGSMIDRHLDSNITGPQNSTVFVNEKKKTLIGKIFGTNSTYTKRRKVETKKGPNLESIARAKKGLGLAARYTPNMNNNVNLLSFG